MVLWWKEEEEEQEEQEEEGKEGRASNLIGSLSFNLLFGFLLFLW